MKVTPLDDGFPHEAVYVEPSDLDRTVADLKTAEIITLFERHGALLFRGFGLAPEGVVPFIDQFTEEYRGDLKRTAERYLRPLRFGQAVLTSVTQYEDSVALHSEAGHGLVWPEVLWFYCNVPSTTGGFTTICDGIRYWRALSPETQRFFLSQPVKYEIELQSGAGAPGGPTVPWPFPTAGVSGHIDKAKGVISLSILRYAVNETRSRSLPGGSIAFTNYLLNPGDPELKRTTMADGTSIPQPMLDEIKAAGEGAISDVHWQPTDLLMVDNRRYMHGRRKFQKGDPRDILQVQTVRGFE